MKPHRLDSNALAVNEEGFRERLTRACALGRDELDGEPKALLVTNVDTSNRLSNSSPELIGARQMPDEVFYTRNASACQAIDEIRSCLELSTSELHGGEGRYVLILWMPE